MFIISPNPLEQTLPLLEQFKEKFGTLPPHFELLATMNAKRFEMFIEEIVYLAAHPNIAADFFAFLRLHVATREGFEYCKSFNTRLLMAKGYSKETIRAVAKEIDQLPLDERHRLLADKALKAVYEADAFGSDDLETLQAAGWSLADIYDAIDHAAFLFKNARIIRAFLA